MDDILLSVVIPSYNETANLQRGVLGEINEYLKGQKFTWEVIVSDDGSSEAEARKLASDFCAKAPNFVFVQNEHAGKPFAVWSGINAAKGKIVLFSDMDQSTPIGQIDEVLPWFDKGYKIVIGSRGVEREQFSLFRRLASMIFREFRRSFLLTDIIDTQAGFKAFTKEVAMEIFPLLQILRTPKEQTVGWRVTSFDVELLVAAKERGYKIAEVPVEWADRDVSTGKAKGTRKFVKESLEMVKEVFRVKLNQLRGFYRK